MSEFDPLQQAQNDAKHHEEVDRYHDWVKDGVSGQINPEAAADLAKYLESRPVLEADNYTELNEARQKLKDHKPVLTSDRKNKGKAKFANNVNGTHDHRASQFIAKNNHKIDKNKDSGWHTTEEMYSDLTDQDFADAYADALSRGDRTTAENLNELMTERGVHERLGKAQLAAQEQRYNQMTMIEMARELAVAEHRGDAKLAEDLDKRLLAKMEQFSLTNNLGEEAQDNLQDRITAVKDRKLAQLSNTLETESNDLDEKTAEEPQLVEAEPQLEMPPGDLFNDADEPADVLDGNVEFDPAEPGSVKPVLPEAEPLVDPILEELRLTKVQYSEELKQLRDKLSDKEFHDILSQLDSLYTKYFSEFAEPNPGIRELRAQVAAFADVKDALYEQKDVMDEAARVLAEDVARAELDRIAAAEAKPKSALEQLESVKSNHTYADKMLPDLKEHAKKLISEGSDPYEVIGALRQVASGPIELIVKNLVLKEEAGDPTKKITDQMIADKKLELLAGVLNGVMPQVEESTPENPRDTLKKELRDAIGNEPGTLANAIEYSKGIQKAHELIDNGQDFEEVIDALVEAFGRFDLEESARQHLKSVAGNHNPTQGQIDDVIEKEVLPKIRRHVKNAPAVETPQVTGPEKPSDESPEEEPESPTDESPDIRQEAENSEPKTVKKKEKAARRADKKARRKSRRYQEKIAVLDNISYAQDAYGLSEDAARTLAAAEKEVFLKGQDFDNAILRGDNLIEAEKVKRERLIRAEEDAFNKIRVARAEELSKPEAREAEVNAKYDAQAQSIRQDYDGKFSASDAAYRAIKDEYPTRSRLEETAIDVADDQNLKDYDPTQTKRTPANRLRRMGRSVLGYNRNTEPRQVKIDWDSVPQDINEEYGQLYFERQNNENFDTSPEYEDKRNRLKELNQILMNNYQLVS